MNINETSSNKKIDTLTFEILLDKKIVIKPMIIINGKLQLLNQLPKKG